jgi:hypothetical protein
MESRTVRACVLYLLISRKLYVQCFPVTVAAEELAAVSGTSTG